MAINLEQFIERLTDCGVMSAAEITAFLNNLPPEQRPRDVKGLVTLLFRAGKLTKYQAKTIYEGKGSSLVFDEYLVLDQIGEGGMGVVLKAEHRRMKRLVAVKILPADKMKAPGAMERFYHEVEAAAKLSHPNIVASYDAREHDGTHCLVMEFVEGRDLAAVVKQRGPLPVPQAVDCIVQAAWGLQYAHGKGIIHRDIKPANLLLDKEGVVKILDMGLARITESEPVAGGSERLTTAGQVMGTCDYMAPEQAFDIRTADHRADIYSLGCTLYRLLTARPPYRGELLMQILVAHRENPIPSLRAVRPEVPVELDECFQRMVAKKPEDRYQSMAEVVAELHAVLAVMSAPSLKAVAAAADSPSEAFAKEWAFMQEASLPDVLGKRKKSSEAAPTEPNMASEKDTDADRPSKAPATRGRFMRKPLVLGALAAGVIALLLGIGLAIAFRPATLVINVEEQAAENVQVAVVQGGQKIQQADAKSGWTLHLNPGDYNLVMLRGDDQFQLDPKSVTLTRGSPVEVQVTRKQSLPEPDKTANAKPASKDSAPERPTAKEVAKPAPAAGKPDDAKPASNESNTDKPKAEEIAKIGPAADKIAAEKIIKDTSDTEKPKSDEEEPAAKSIDPPSADDQRRLIHEIDEVYKLDEAKDQAAKAALALKLLDEGRRNKSDRAEQFVMLRRASEIASSAGEPDLMLDAIDAMAAAGFKIQLHQVKARLLERVVQLGAAGSASQVSAISESCVRFAEEAAASGAVDEATEVLDVDRKALAEPLKRAQTACRIALAALPRATSLADKAEREKKAGETQGDLDTIKSAQSALADCAKGLQQARREYTAIKAAQERLKTSPDDANTCLAVGRWYCFTLGNWDEGLKLLANGSDAALKAVAAQDMTSKAATAEDKVACGDAWWSLTDKAAGIAKAAMRRRAAYWYHAALPDLTAGVEKARVEKRLAQPLPEASGKTARVRPSLAVAPFNEKTAKLIQARWAKYLRTPVVQTNSIGMKLVIIPPGEFDQGSPKELIDEESRTHPDPHLPGEAPRHRVKLTKPYWLGVTPVTQEEYQRVIGSNPSKFPGDGKRPVEQVSWDEAVAFCRRLSESPSEKAAKRQYRLPTEAEWEYACRAGSPGPWSFSPPPGPMPAGWEEKLVAEYVWSAQTAANQTHAVGQKRANSWGLYDMCGNVWQRCQDWYDMDYYPHSSGDDPTGPTGGSGHAIRGGSWCYNWWTCRSGYRMGLEATTRIYDTGFRVVLNVAE